MTKVICIGEVLWDQLPKGLFLGGAPLNVAVNLRRLGIDAQLISAIGDDELGKNTLQNMSDKGFDTSLVQLKNYPTGLVEVNLNDNGIPTYTIKKSAAWDNIEWNPAIEKLCKTADYIFFGSLAQRCTISRNTIRKVLKQTNAKRIFDMNIRLPFYNWDIIKESLRLSDILKVNEDELQIILQEKNIALTEEKAVQYLQEKYNLEKVIITKGDRGASLYDGVTCCKSSGIDIQVKDTVGAGDAFLAAFIYGLINKSESYEILNFANQLGAFVASKDGATPELNEFKSLLSPLSTS